MNGQSLCRSGAGLTALRQQPFLYRATVLVRFDSNKYAVVSKAVGRPVEVFAYADKIIIKQDGAILAEHARCFGREQTIYDPWHYVPVLARKPGATQANVCSLRKLGCNAEWRAVQGLGSASRD
jgi:hypothetical protein